MGNIYNSEAKPPTDSNSIRKSVFSYKSNKIANSRVFSIKSDIEWLALIAVSSSRGWNEIERFRNSNKATSTWHYQEMNTTQIEPLPEQTSVDNNCLSWEEAVLIELFLSLASEVERQRRLTHSL